MVNRTRYLERSSKAISDVQNVRDQSNAALFLVRPSEKNVRVVRAEKVNKTAYDVERSERLWRIECSIALFYIFVWLLGT